MIMFVSLKTKKKRFSIDYFLFQLRTNLQRSVPQAANNQNTSAQGVTKNLPYDRNNAETITDDVIEISPEIDNQQSPDDDLER